MGGKAYHSEPRIAAQEVQQRWMPILAPGLQVFRERSAFAGRCQIKWADRSRRLLIAVLVVPPGTGHSNLSTCEEAFVIYNTDNRGANGSTRVVTTHQMMLNLPASS